MSLQTAYLGLCGALPSPSDPRSPDYQPMERVIYAGGGAKPGTPFFLEQGLCQTGGVLGKLEAEASAAKTASAYCTLPRHHEPISCLSAMGHGGTDRSNWIQLIPPVPSRARPVIRHPRRLTNDRLASLKWHCLSQGRKRTSWRCRWRRTPGSRRRRSPTPTRCSTTSRTASPSMPATACQTRP